MSFGETKAVAGHRTPNRVAQAGMKRTAILLIGMAFLLARIAQAKTYLTVEQALKTAFPAAQSYDLVTVKPDDAMLKKAETILKRPQKNVEIPFYKATQGSALLGYAGLMNEIGKEQPITFLVAITPDFRVQEVVVLEYRESRGGEVVQSRFLNQYKGKTLRSPIQVGNDIKNITGATISSNAISYGVKKALVYAELAFSGSTTVAPPVQAAKTRIETQEHMGTLVKVTVNCGTTADCTGAIASAFAEIKKVDDLMSNYKPDSDLSRVNLNAGRQAVEVSPDTMEVALLAKKFYEDTSGAFDPTIGPLMALWGFGPGAKKGDSRAVPSTDAIADTLKSVGFDKVEINVQSSTIFLKQAGMKLDFGGIAKGYAAAKSIAAVQKAGVAGATVAVSGDIAYFGVSESGPWSVAIQHPRDRTKTIGMITLKGEGAISTSGDYEKSFMADGKRYSHIFNPRTGYPVEGSASATVLILECTDSSRCASSGDDALHKGDARLTDALATSLYLLGPSGLDLVKKYSGEGLFIGYDEKGMLHAVASSGFPLDPKALDLK